MNHDITHCDGRVRAGIKCPKRVICERYQAHKELKKLRSTVFMHPAYLNPKDCVEKGCKYIRESKHEIDE